jgi:hypothetical protein
MERLRRKRAMLGLLDRPTELTSPQGERRAYSDSGPTARRAPDCESRTVSIPMKARRKMQPSALWLFAALLLLTGCGEAEPQCDSLDTHNSVVKIISDDSNNALVSYAVKNSSSVAAMADDTNTEAEKLAIREKARQSAVYRLDDTVATNSRNRATRSVSCSGVLYVTVGDVTAQKQVDFKVEQTADGKTSVSVAPFLF